MIIERLKEIRHRIEQAARRGGRDPGEIKLVAVAKGQPKEQIVKAVKAGVTDIGENYAQELLAHHAAVGGRVEWHFVGHLQRNKVRPILDPVSLIHSVDSERLAQEIAARAAQLGKKQGVLIEINLGDESSKTGLRENELGRLLGELKKLDSLEVKGLMVLPPYHPEPEKIRPFFRRLREIRDAINKENLYKQPIQELSMGMTHDFEVAIEEGATIVRIGTGIFGKRPS